MYEFFLKCEATCSWTPSPVTNCHTFSDPLPPSSVTYFMDGPQIDFFVVKLSYVDR